VTLSPTDRLDLAGDIMRLGRIRHLPVIEDGRLVGVVSQRDLLAASLSKTLDFEAEHRRSFSRSVEVAEVMSRDLVTVENAAPLGLAAERMVDRQIGCLPVVDADGALVGLLTETDLVRAAFLSDERAARPVEASEVPAAARVVSSGPGARGASRAEELADRIGAELEALRRVRDELRLQAHLAKAEARGLWDDLELKFRDAESKVKLVLHEAEGPAEDLAEAASELLRDLREGYRRLREGG